MSAARLVCSAAVFCGFVLYGAVSGARKKAALEEAEAVRKDVAELSNIMELTRTPMLHITGELAKKSALARLWSEVHEGISSGLAPSEALLKCRGLLKNEKAADLLCELFAGLGSSCIDAEECRIDITLKKLDELIRGSRADTEKSQKLVSSLSVLMGLAAALLLL